MSRPYSEEQKKQWKEKLIAQKNSNLSISAWCRQNKIAEHIFYYWKKKLSSKSTITRSTFAEIPLEKDYGLQSESSGIRLEYQNIHIHLDKKFDLLALKQCLSVLKEGHVNCSW